MSLFGKAHRVFTPGEGVGEVYTKVLNAGDHLHSCAVNVKRRRNVLRMMVEDTVLLILTDWGLFVRKSRTQLQSDGASPRVDSLFTSVCSMMVLKAEVKSKNSSLT